MRPEPLDQNIGRGDEVESFADMALIFEVEFYRTAATLDEIARIGLRLPGPIDAYDIGAHVGEQHGRKRTRAYPGKFENLEPPQRTADGASIRLT
jgi:hypothetical protein